MAEVTGRRKAKIEAGRTKEREKNCSGNKEDKDKTPSIVKRELGGLFAGNR